MIDEICTQYLCIEDICDIVQEIKSVRARLEMFLTSVSEYPESRGKAAEVLYKHEYIHHKCTLLSLKKVLEELKAVANEVYGIND